MKMSIIIDEDGRVKTIGTLGASFGEIVEKHKNSWIVPKNPFLRSLFKLIRKTFGDSGKMAEWTRKWKCDWIVVLKNGQKIGPFRRRIDALKAEIEELSKALKTVKKEEHREKQRNI